jgi:hypothetical protein
MGKLRQGTTNTTPEKLQVLMAGANDGMAIRAAWETVRRDLAHDIAAHRHQGREGTLLTGAARFVGFLEGRLRVPVPRWWAAGMTGARADNLETINFFASRGEEYHLGPRGLSSEFGVVPTVKRSNNGDVTVAWDNRALTLSAKELLETQNAVPLDNLTALIYRDHCLVVRYDHESFPALKLELYCVDVRSTKVVWSIKRSFGKRFGSGPMGRTGIGIHEVGLVCRDDIVFVFGMEIAMSYIESLRLSDGHPVMRFNNTY